MRRTILNNAQKLLAVVVVCLSLFATACAGSRQKQALTVKPAPGKQSSEQLSKNTEPQPLTPDNGSANTNGVTDIIIDAELDNSSSGGGTSPSPGWDGKSFRGIGKWKVTPV